MIIGITGPICSGKSEVVSILGEEYGFEIVSIKDEILKEAEKRGIKTDRSNLQDLGNEMTKKFGESYWALKIVDKIDESKDYVVETFRYPGQVFAFNKFENFKLVGVTASYEVRMKRYLEKRKRKGDGSTEEDFEIADKRDSGVNDSTGQKTAETYKLINYEIVNDGTLKELKENVKILVDYLKSNA